MAYGEKWKKEMMKFTKKQLVEKIKKLQKKLDVPAYFGPYN